VNPFGIALFFANCVAVVFVVRWRAQLRKQYGVIQKYPLFAVRDSLVRLHIDGQFDADPELYERYVESCNTLIRHTQELNLGAFLVAVGNLTSPEEGRRMSEWRKRIAGAPGDVRYCIDSFYGAALAILRQNSTLLRILIRAPRAEVFVAAVGRSRRIRAPQLDAVVEYQELARLRSQLIPQAA
jgi:hypothetical protein